MFESVKNQLPQTQEARDNRKNHLYKPVACGLALAALCFTVNKAEAAQISTEEGRYTTAIEKGETASVTIREGANIRSTPRVPAEGEDPNHIGTTTESETFETKAGVFTKTGNNGKFYCFAKGELKKATANKLTNAAFLGWTGHNKLACVNEQKAYIEPEK